MIDSSRVFLAGMDIVRWGGEMVPIECTTPAYPMRMPIVSNNQFIPGREYRVISAPATVLSRKSRAFNIAASNSGGDAYGVILQGTSANHPDMRASDNMAALAACIRGAACDLDTRHPRRIKSITAVLEVNNGARPNPVDAHTIMMIEGKQDLIEIVENLQMFLYHRGTMCRALHDTDDSQVNIHVWMDRLQKDFVFLEYMMKCESRYRRNRNDVFMQRIEETWSSAGINAVGNSLDNLFILHRKKTSSDDAGLDDAGLDDADTEDDASNDIVDLTNSDAEDVDTEDNASEMNSSRTSNAEEDDASNDIVDLTNESEIDSRRSSKRARQKPDWYGGLRGDYSTNDDDE